MNPLFNNQPMIAHDEEDLEDEELSDTSSSLDDSNISDDSITSDDSNASDDSTFMDLEPAIPSTSSVQPAIAGNSSTEPVIGSCSTNRNIPKYTDDFRFEAARLLSFRNWLVPTYDPVSLAAAGFYYTGRLDKVKCFACQVVVSHWLKGRTPMQVHQLWSPKCRFVNNEYCGNVPIGADSDKILQTERRYKNIICPYGLEYSESFDFNDYRFLRQTNEPTAYELSLLGLKTVKEPDNLNYASFQSRLNSFQTWPTHMKYTVTLLVDAGFYYTGINDITTCYHCGVIIGNWNEREDPWYRHAISSTACCYLLTVRGWEYVNHVTGQKLYATSAAARKRIIYRDYKKVTSENKTNEMTLEEKVAALEEKYRKLKCDRLCKVCTEREAAITFLPCRHLVTCQYCYRAFVQCIICRKRIKAVTRIYFS